MTKIEIAQKALALTAGLGGSKIVSGIVRNNTNPQNLADAVSISVAGYALGVAAGNYAGIVIEKQVEELHKLWTDLRQKTAQN